MACNELEPATSDRGAGGYWGGRRKLRVTAVHRIHRRTGWLGEGADKSNVKGPTQAANPKNRAVPLMEAVGACLRPLVFAPVDQIFHVKFRVVKGLPYAMVLGAALMKDNRSIISFDGEEGFRPTPSSSWVPFAPKEVGEAAAGAMCAELYHYCAVKPSTDEQEPEELEEPRSRRGLWS